MNSLFSRNNIISAISILLIVAVWEILAGMLNSGALLPGPLNTGEVFVGLMSSEDFWRSLASTLIRGLAGFAIAAVLSLFVGIPSGLHSGIDAFFTPLLVIVRSTPVISIILLALIWFQVEQVPVFIGFLTMFPILTTNIAQGIRSTDKGLIQMAKVYKVRRRDILRSVYLQGIYPFLFPALITASGFGWRAIIIGEVLSQPRYGIGSMMQQAQSYLLVAEVISWTVVAVVTGYLFEQLIRMLKKQFMIWEQQ